MTISKVIHQTWKDENVPEHFNMLSETWKKNHPDWEYILWTDKMNRDFIRINFPDFLEKYDNYPANIQRVDAVRYFILYKMGGMFIDLDYECLKNVEPLLDNFCVFGLEPTEHCKIHRKEIIISNAFMAGMAGSDFFKRLCDELYGYKQYALNPFDNILESTGPFMLTRVFNECPRKDQIKLLPFNIIYPLTKNEISATLWAKKMSQEIKLKIEAAYAIHYYWGTWWQANQQIHNTFSTLKKRL